MTSMPVAEGQLFIAKGMLSARQVALCVPLKKEMHKWTPQDPLCVHPDLSLKHSCNVAIELLK